MASCSDCGEDRSEKPGPCPKCGSRNRTFRLEPAVETDTAQPLGWMQKWIEPFRASWSKRRRWGKSGRRKDATGRWVDFHDEYEKGGNRRERVVDIDSGEVIVDQDHPLTQHRGHGSAKKREE